MKNLTILQQELIKDAKEENDFCIVSTQKTMTSLVDKGYAKWTSGFGYKFGRIIELTEKGKAIKNK